MPGIVPHLALEAEPSGFTALRLSLHPKCLTDRFVPRFGNRRPLVFRRMVCFHLIWRHGFQEAWLRT